MDELVERLCVEGHNVVVGGPSPSAEELRRRISELGYVFIKFPDSQGGTDLGVRVDETATDLGKADFTNASGSVHLEGTLTLNYVKVRCVADIDLASLSGTGHLVALDEALAK
ncbi:uroporphyrinogen-III synthase [Salinactinospora qingdaonensis]|uniref:MbtH domain protein n=1 Tax=Salinactinospora qingdaonensis TaxID=702744 RepID=A0ABP7G623_9ACTN